MSQINTINLDDCWLWARTINTDGYGVVWNGSNYSKAHRVVYEYYKGAIPEGLVIDHLCRVTRCVNPNHLEVVTNKENIRRGLQTKRNRTHCKHGHKYTVQTVYWDTSRGKRARVCRICRQMHQRNRKLLRIGGCSSSNRLKLV